MQVVKKVSFDQVEIVELSMILGDHPGCTSGPPVQVSWDEQSRTTLQIDAYANARGPRRRIDDLYLSEAARRIM